ncbi:hypothetical protein [Streptomyces ureilyticus]|uniref:Uncharacterized protein n=1 Tax=Streptomyces ureilyticus TaxID=1775131 RepID=A0ABX0DPZ7_9ACTN|nr:hypothetical protein [Streptomyces ureilyticus]NGO41854.1 hypothetical protein [Streptomyces ureilyticus]
MPWPTERAATVFDVLGPVYEQAFAHAEAHLASLEWLLGRLALGSRMLDVGSGTGRCPTGAVSPHRSDNDGSGFCGEDSVTDWQALTCAADFR